MPNLFRHPKSNVYIMMVTYPMRCRNKFGMTLVFFTLSRKSKIQGTKKSICLMRQMLVRFLYIIV
jgi:hypothetical protein